MADAPVHPKVVLRSYWRASWTDTPQELSGRAIPPTEQRLPPEAPAHCARCGEGGLEPHSASDDSGTGWRQLYWQLRCLACGAYSLFHYDD